MTNAPAKRAVLLRLIDAPVSVTDINCTRDGTVSFRIAMGAIGATMEQVFQDRFSHMHTCVNFVGEALLAANLDKFSDLLITKQKQYERMCYCARHEDFGLLVRNSSLEFTCHISLLCWRLNDAIAEQMGESGPAEYWKRARRRDRSLGEEAKPILLQFPRRSGISNSYTFNARVRKVDVKKVTLLEAVNSMIKHGLKEMGERNLGITVAEDTDSLRVSIDRHTLF